MTSTPTVTIGHATLIGDRDPDAVGAITTPLGSCAALVSGINETDNSGTAVQLAADVAAAVGAHRGARAGIMAAADTMPGYLGAPNAVAAAASVLADGYIELAHLGDVAIWAWDRRTGLRQWTADQDVQAHIDHLRRNPGDTVIDGLAYAMDSTITWTPLLDVAPELILLTSADVHTALTGDQIVSLITQHQNNSSRYSDPQYLASGMVTAAGRRGISARTGEVLTAPPDNAAVVVIRIHHELTERNHP